MTLKKLSRKQWVSWKFFTDKKNLYTLLNTTPNVSQWCHNVLQNYPLHKYILKYQYTSQIYQQTSSVVKKFNYLICNHSNHRSKVRHQQNKNNIKQSFSIDLGLHGELCSLSALTNHILRKKGVILSKYHSCGNGIIQVDMSSFKINIFHCWKFTFKMVKMSHVLI